MRVAILSDIHGNLRALDAVLSDMERRGGADRTVCLGDVAATGPQPRAVIEFLRGSQWPCVMGNMDEILAKDAAEELGADVPGEEKRKIMALDAWTRGQISESDRGYLSTFRPTVALHSRGGPNLLLYHGSPLSNVKGIYPTMPDRELRAYVEGHRTDVFAGGHTHAQMLRRLDGSVIINPGSVGLPFNKTSSGRILHPAHAEYAIVSSVDGVLEVELISAPYPLPELKKAVDESGMPDPDWWLSDWYRPDRP